MKDIHMVVAAFLMSAFTMGPMKSIGPFFISFERSFDATAGQASLVSSLIYGTMYLGGPFASFLAKKLGYRRTIMLGSVLASVGAILCTFSKSIISVQIFSSVIGLGCCLTTIPRMAILGSHFREKRSFVNNVMSMGSALISIPLSPLVQLWIDEYSWRGSILLIGGLMLNSLPSGLLLTTTAKRGRNKKASIDVALLKSFPFCTYIVACGCTIGAALCVRIYIVRFAQSRGVNDYFAAILPSITSIIDLALRPVSGYLTSLSHIGPIRIQRLYIFLGLLIIQSLVALCYTFCWTFEAMVVTAILYSIISGCRGTLSLTLTADLFGGEKFVSALGWRYLSMGLFSTTVPPLMGRIVESRGSYAVPFYAATVLYLLSATFVAIVRVSVSKGSKESERTNTEAKSKVSLEIVEKRT